MKEQANITNCLAHINLHILHLPGFCRGDAFWSCRDRFFRGFVGFFGELAGEGFSCQNAQPALFAFRFGGGYPIFAELLFARVERLAVCTQFIERRFCDGAFCRLAFFLDGVCCAARVSAAAAARGDIVFRQ